jgi:Phage gp6-like head-tail connector protein
MIDLANIKAHLNVTTDADDALIAEKLTAAAEWVAKFTGIPTDATDMPAPVNEGVRLLTAHLYENREASLVGVTAQSLPFGLVDLLGPYREWAF